MSRLKRNLTRALQQSIVAVARPPAEGPEGGLMGQMKLHRQLSTDILLYTRVSRAEIVRAHRHYRAQASRFEIWANVY